MGFTPHFYQIQTLWRFSEREKVKLILSNQAKQKENPSAKSIHITILSSLPYMTRFRVQIALPLLVVIIELFKRNFKKKNDSLPILLQNHAVSALTNPITSNFHPL